MTYKPVPFQPSAAPADAREAIARVAGMCTYAARHAAPHDHSHCLIEADELLSMLAIAGYRVVGITDLVTLQEASA